MEQDTKPKKQETKNTKRQISRQLSLCHEVIDHQGSADDEQSKELPGLLNVGFGCLHSLRDMGSFVFGDPVQHPVLYKK